MGTGGRSSLFLPLRSRAARNCSKNQSTQRILGKKPFNVPAQESRGFQTERAWHTNMETDVLWGHQGSECFIQVTQQCFQPVVLLPAQAAVQGGEEGWKARNAHLPSEVATGEERLPPPTLEERRHRGKLPEKGYMPHTRLERGAGPSEGSCGKLVTGTNQ